MDNQDILKTYDKLPKLRRQVLDRILIGYSTKKIAEELFNGEYKKIREHRREIYKRFDYCLLDFDTKLKRWVDIDLQSKLYRLIVVFYNEAPNLISEIKIKLGYHIPSIDPPPQFGELTKELIKQKNKYKFELHKLLQKNEILKLQDLGRKYFKTQDHLPTDLLESWYKKDSNYFRKIVDKNGDIVGFFIILFIKPNHLINFATGKLIEKEIDESKVFAANELNGKQENHLYISVVVGEGGHIVKNTCVLLCLARYLDEIRKYRKVTKLYATAATDDGKNLMQEHLEFNLCIGGDQRKDKEDFLELDLKNISNEESLFELLLSKSPAFKRYLPNVDFGNESAWIPNYLSTRK